MLCQHPPTVPPHANRRYREQSGQALADATNRSALGQLVRRAGTHELHPQQAYQLKRAVMKLPALAVQLGVVLQPSMATC